MTSRDSSHVVHIAVAIVVMTDVFLVEIRQRADLVGCTHILPIPCDHFVLTVRIERRPQHQDHVIENRVYRRIALGRNQLVAKQDGLLSTGDFGGVQAAVDVDDGLAFARQRLGLFVGETPALGQAARDVLIFVKLRQIPRRGDDGNLPIQATRGLADRNDLDAIGSRRQFVEVVARFVVVGEVEIVAGLVAQDGFGGWNRLRRRGCQ